MNGKAKLAWELYLRTESSQDSLLLLNQLANDCYRMGAFYFAAKAFAVMERYDSQPEYWEGKRGACIGVLQQVIAGEEPAESLREVLEILRSGPSSHPQQEHVAAVIAKWCAANGVRFSV
jgi:intraflagellar transport protein 56